MSDTRAQSNSGTATSPRRGVAIRLLNATAIVIAAALALIALGTLEKVFDTDAAHRAANDAYYECGNAATELQTASDYLTTQCRMYVVTHDRVYLDNYLTEFLESNRRGRAVGTLRSRLEDKAAIDSLQQALDYSNELAERELYAMRLVADATGLDDPPTSIAEVDIDSEDDALGTEQKLEKATDLVLDKTYQSYKKNISREVNECSAGLIYTLNLQRTESDKRLQELLTELRIIVIALLCIVVLVIFSVIFLVLWPLSSFAHNIKQGKALVHSGAAELRILVNAYNAMFDENHRRTTYLRHEAEHDALTGLYNRRAYDELVGENKRGMALLLLDIDRFKEINDKYGHETGDEVLKKVARAISSSFRPTDYPCRIGGDEFAVVATGIYPNLEQVITAKIKDITTALHDVSDGLPDITVSVGVAFSDDLDGETDIYRAADKALYTVKESGRNGYAFYNKGHCLAK